MPASLPLSQFQLCLPQNTLKQKLSAVVVKCVCGSGVCVVCDVVSLTVGEMKLKVYNDILKISINMLDYWESRL